MPPNVSRFCCASKMVTASEAREPDAHRDCSNRLLGGSERPIEVPLRIHTGFAPPDSRS